MLPSKTKLRELYERSTLDKWLSRALGLKIPVTDQHHQAGIHNDKTSGAVKNGKLPESGRSVKEKIGIVNKSEKSANTAEPEVRIKAIDDMQYVLTLDYTLKMLNIHERRECGIPVIIEGETGVGKTALIQMLSQLWNHAWLEQWGVEKSKLLLDDVEKILEGNL